MKKVLLVEYSKILGKKYTREIESKTSHQVEWVNTKKEALSILDNTTDDFFLAIVDFNLPDSPKGEIIDEMLKRKIPTIVFTDLVDEETRKTIWSKSVVDYVLKSDNCSLEYIISMTERINQNAEIKVLVVDDSKLFRVLLSSALKVHLYDVLEAGDGQQALDVLKENPDIKLVITDCIMPVMDGFDLINNIRQDFSKDELAIIGISSAGKNDLSARLIKSGANDFIIKQSFLKEEFYCRVNQCISAIENIQKVRDAAIKDFLTGMYNRRYFFDAGIKLLAGAIRKDTPLVCGMVDIDHFKKVNDTYGHDVGDIAIKHVADTLQNRFRETDIVSRFGGEEFCILAPDLSKEDAAKLFEDVRNIIETTPINIGHEQEISITISIGVQTERINDLDEMVKQSDLMLYEAKETGRNKVVMK